MKSEKINYRRLCEDILNELIELSDDDINDLASYFLLKMKKKKGNSFISETNLLNFKEFIETY